MRESTSVDPQQSGEIQSSVADPLPSEVAVSRPVVRRGPLQDPLGYDTTDLRQVALAMADAAESGRNRDAVRAEIAAVERRLGIA